MDLNILLETAGHQICAEADACLSVGQTVAGIEIKSLHHDSRTVQKGGLFFALAGTGRDGVKFIKQAVRNGAVCVVHGSEVIRAGIFSVKCKCVCVCVKDVRLAMSLMAKVFYGGCCDRMKMIAAVGTNGKTTVVNMLSQVLKKNVGVIGTLGIVINGKRSAHNMTTPDPIDLHRTLKEMHEQGVHTAVMEVSAHAIHFRKLAGITFDLGVFTNITQDHLDFFYTFENYCNTKLDYFIRSKAIKKVITNIDCPFGKRISAARPETAVTYSCSENADFEASGINLFPAYSEFTVNKVHKVRLNIPAGFNVSNALAVFAAASELGIGVSAVQSTFSALNPIAGRYNAYRVRDFTAVVDFAHTPDGLAKIIASVRETIDKKCRIITVFGCGGDRDRKKRPLMGKAAAELSDFVIVTSDNPRSEEPLAVMREIEAGIVSAEDTDVCSYAMIENRAAAVEHALTLASAGDVVIIAGKGGEETQEVNGFFHKYKDESVIKKFVKRISYNNN